MLRKALTLGIIFILALSLLAVSMITCFTYDAEADAGNHAHYICYHGQHEIGPIHIMLGAPFLCVSQ